MYRFPDHTHDVLERFAVGDGFVPIAKRIWIWYRAGGGVICTVCGREYYDHPPEEDPEFCERHTAHWVTHTLRVLCNGDRVHL